MVSSLTRRTAVIAAAACFGAAVAQAQDKSIIIGHFGTPLPFHAAVVSGEFEKATGWKIEWRKFGAGPDVIAVHRLLKNGLASNRYLLLTESAFQALRPAGSWMSATEDLEGLGRQDIRWLPLHAPIGQTTIRRFSLSDHWRKMRYTMTGWFGRRSQPAG